MTRSPWLISGLVFSATVLGACGSSSYSGQPAATTAPAAVATAAPAKATTPPVTTKAAAATTTKAAAATTTAAAGAAGLVIKNFTFVPATFSAPAGDIAVKNDDSAAHTVTSDDGKSFDVSLGGGETGTISGITAGTYKYHCAIHPSMKGTLTVT
jgi:plastocyanin